MSQATAQFAMWLEREHPDIYEVLYAQAHQASTLSGLGDDGLISIDFSPDDISLTSEASDAINYSDFLNSFEAPIQTLSFERSGSQQTISQADTPISAPNVITQPSSGSSGGILSALSSVGNWIVSPQGLTSLANVGTAVLKVQQAQATAQLQQAVIQANAQRAVQNKNPLPITYMTDDTGHLVPVYDMSVGTYMPPQLEQAIQQGSARPVTLPDGSTGYTIDSPTLTSLFGSSIPWWFWLVGGALILAIAM